MNTNRKIKLTIILLFFLFSLANPTTSYAQSSSSVRKVLSIDFNPILEIRNNKTVRQYFGWNDPITLESQFITDVKNASGNSFTYTVVQRITNIDGYPLKNNGYAFTDNDYIAAVNGSPNSNSQALINYLKVLDDYNVCDMVNNGEIDEVWLWGGPWFGYYEAMMTGPGAWFTNSSPLTGSACNKRVIIMGFNYERGVPEMLEDLAHSLEGTLSYVFKEEPRFYARIYTTPWGKFATSDKTSPGNSGCGWIHYAPNSQSDYDWTNTRFVNSTCNDWLKYPNLTGETESINCTKWGCSDYGFKKWWLSHIPKSNGVTNGKYNNWWKYMYLYLIGDINIDDKVNIVDVGFIIDNYNKSPILNKKSDLNNDGIVNIIDIGIIIDNYGLSI